MGHPGQGPRIQYQNIACASERVAFPMMSSRRLVKSRLHYNFVSAPPPKAVDASFRCLGIQWKENPRKQISGRACNTKLANAETQEVGTPFQNVLSANNRPGTLPPLSPLPIAHSGEVRHTGRNAGGTPKNDALAPFAGRLKTEADQGGHFILAVSVNGTQASAFTNDGGDPKYNGTIAGTISGNQMRYTYVQPAVNRKGSGFFVPLNNETRPNWGTNANDAVQPIGRLPFQNSKTPSSSASSRIW